MRQNKSVRILYPAFILSFVFFVLLPLNADAAYRIYLKNGSVIKGVGHYEKSEGEIRFYFGGDMIGIPEEDILKIEESDEPVKEMKAPEESSEAARPVELEREATPVKKPGQPQPSELDKINEKISQKEEELRQVEEDLQRTMIRIQALYGKSGKGTISSDERSMLQQNMVKKKKLEDDKKRLENELKALREEKENLAK